MKIIIPWNKWLGFSTQSGEPWFLETGMTD
jgi:hypothetical protein